jgi:hypothetical protein
MNVQLLTGDRNKQVCKSKVLDSHIDAQDAKIIHQHRPISGFWTINFMAIAQRLALAVWLF